MSEQDLEHNQRQYTTEEEEKKPRSKQKICDNPSQPRSPDYDWSLYKHDEETTFNPRASMDCRSQQPEVKVKRSWFFLYE